jgi:hypothetical protein
MEKDSYTLSGQKISKRKESKIESLQADTQTHLDVEENQGKVTSDTQLKYEKLLKEYEKTIIEKDSIIAKIELERISEAEQLSTSKAKVFELEDNNKKYAEKNTELYESNCLLKQESQSKIELLESKVQQIEENNRDLQIENQELLEKIQKTKLREEQNDSLSQNAEMPSVEDSENELNFKQISELKLLNGSLSEEIKKIQDQLEKIIAERDFQIEKIDHMKNAFSIKMKEKIEYSDKLEKMYEEAQQEIESLKLEVENNLASIDEKSNQTQINLQISNITEQLNKSEAENSRLRNYMIELEENSTQEIVTLNTAVEEFKHQILYLEREREQLQLLGTHNEEQRNYEQELLIETKSENKLLVQEVESLNFQKSQDLLVIQNLQQVLAQLETCKLFF